MIREGGQPWTDTIAYRWVTLLRDQHARLELLREERQQALKAPKKGLWIDLLRSNND